MSEFSNSFHLRSNEMLDGVELLQRARVQGFVFRPANGWVPIVFPCGFGMDDKRERIVAANRHLAVHYDFAEDHGVRLDAYRGPDRVAKLSVSFETEDARFDSAKLVELGLISETSAREIQQWVVGGRDRGLLVVAAALGLPRHSWFSYDYASPAPAPSRDERVEVSKDGSLVVDEEDVP